VVQEQDLDLVEEGLTLNEEDPNRLNDATTILDEESSVPDVEDHH